MHFHTQFPETLSFAGAAANVYKLFMSIPKKWIKMKAV